MHRTHALNPTKPPGNLGYVHEAAPTPNVTDTSLVFEGGAMRVVFSAALVEALLESNVNFAHVTGNSAATSHVANYVSRTTDRMRKTFTTFPSDPNFGGWRAWLRGDGFFNAGYIYGEAGMPGQPMGMDWEIFNNSPVQYRISGFNALTGETKHWGRESIHSPEDFLIRARASSSLPVFMPATVVDGQPWFDGAFGPTGGIPIDAAMQDDYDRFLVIMTRTRMYRKSAAGRALWLLRRTHGHYPALLDSIADRHVRYNETRDYLFELEKQGKAYLFIPEIMNISNQDRNPVKLSLAYQEGLEQARREMPAIKEFLGLS